MWCVCFVFCFLALLPANNTQPIVTPFCFLQPANAEKPMCAFYLHFFHEARDTHVSATPFSLAHGKICETGRRRGGGTVMMRKKTHTRFVCLFFSFSLLGVLWWWWWWWWLCETVVREVVSCPRPRVCHHRAEEDGGGGGGGGGGCRRSAVEEPWRYGRRLSNSTSPRPSVTRDAAAPTPTKIHPFVFFALMFC